MADYYNTLTFTPSRNTSQNSSTLDSSQQQNIRSTPTILDLPPHPTSFYHQTSQPKFTYPARSPYRPTYPQNNAQTNQAVSPGIQGRTSSFQSNPTYRPNQQYYSSGASPYSSSAQTTSPRSYPSSLYSSTPPPSSLNSTPAEDKVWNSIDTNEDKLTTHIVSREFRLNPESTQNLVNNEGWTEGIYDGFNTNARPQEQSWNPERAPIMTQGQQFPLPSPPVSNQFDYANNSVPYVHPPQDATRYAPFAKEREREKEERRRKEEDDFISEDEEYNEGRKRQSSTLQGIPTHSRTPLRKKKDDDEKKKKKKKKERQEESKREGWTMIGEQEDEDEDEEEDEDEDEGDKRKKRRNNLASTYSGTPRGRGKDNGGGGEEEEEPYSDTEKYGSRKRGKKERRKGGQTVNNYDIYASGAPDSRNYPLTEFDTLPSTSFLIREQKFYPKNNRFKKMNPMELYHAYRQTQWERNPAIMHSTKGKYERRERAVLNRMPKDAAMPFQPVETVQEQLRKRRYRYRLEPNRYVIPPERRRDDVIWNNRSLFF